MKTKHRKIDDSYLELIRKFPLRTIRSPAEYDAATAVAEQLYLSDENDLDVGERDYLDAIDEFIAGYDRQYFNLGQDKRTPLQRLKWIIDQSGTTPKALQQIFGCSQTLVSMILNGKRELSEENIKALATHLRVQPGLFL
jgi:HTH-type transcriptional regulator/antitoxin HigA